MPRHITFDEQQDLEVSQDILLESSQFTKSGSNSDFAQTYGAPIQCLETASIDGDPASGFHDDNDRPASISGFLGSDSHSDIIYVPGFRAPQKTSAFLISSSILPLSPETSHHLELKSGEPLAFTSSESFKSTEGLSDDILSRSILKEDLATETKSDCCGNPENHANISLSSLSGSLKMTRAATTIDSDASEAGHCSLTSENELKQSHEETVISFVSDHSNVPSSPPIVPIEYSQSGSYLDPATIIRGRNAVCQLTFPSERFSHFFDLNST